jgi:hypothetical protein
MSELMRPFQFAAFAAPEIWVGLLASAEPLAWAKRFGGAWLAKPGRGCNGLGYSRHILNLPFIF